MTPHLLVSSYGMSAMRIEVSERPVIGFLVDDVYAACDALEPLGYGFKKKPDEGKFNLSSGVDWDHFIKKLLAIL